MKATMPHERELAGILEEAFNAYRTEKEDYLALIITDSTEHVRYLLQRLLHGTEWDAPTKLFRDGIEVKGGGKIVVMSMGDPGRLMGLRPNKIVLFGKIGEMYYWMKAMECPIEAIA